MDGRDGERGERARRDAVANPYRGVALTVAGATPAAGAGVEADLKTFEALRVFGRGALRP
jgi:hypothetical protein